MIDKTAGEYIRRTILSRYKPQRQNNCVCVARGNNRRLLNEDRIIEFLQEAGFEVFYPDRAGHFYDEVDFFSTANCIVSCEWSASMIIHRM